MPSTIGLNEIALLQALVIAGDRIAYYTQLAAWGDDYGRLALGVVNNDTLSGATANIYFVQHAGPNGSASAVPFDTLANISLDLMRADFDRRQAAFNAGQNALDLPVDTIHSYHTQVFAVYGVEPIAWTPHFALDQLATTAEREALWDELLQAGGLTGNVNAYVQSLVSAVSSNVVGFAAYSFDLTAAGALATTAPSTDYGPYSVSLGANLGSVIGGNASSNTLTGTSFGDVIMGFDGADEIVASDGNDRLYGGEGMDRLVGGGGRDFLLGGDGDDVLIAGNAQAPGATVNTGLLNLSSFPGGMFGEGSWSPSDFVADYLVGGAGNDTYWVGADAGVRLNLGPGGSLRSINGDRRAEILDVGTSGQFIFNHRVFENIDVILDSDGEGIINWGLDGAITPVTGPLYSLAENCSGTFSSGNPLTLTRSERFSDLLSAISGKVMDVYRVPRTTGQLGQYPLLATFVKLTNSEGVTFDRLLFFTDPTRDGIDYIYDGGNNIQILGNMYGVFAIDGYYSGIETPNFRALFDSLMATGTNGTFGINIQGYVPHYDGNDGANNIVGSGGGDVITGGGGNDNIFGGHGNDTIDGGQGDDELLGGTGNDTFTDIAGSNTVDGGEGIDTLQLSNGRSAYTITQTGNLTTITGNGATHTLTNIEFVQFTNPDGSITEIAVEDLLTPPNSAPVLSISINDVAVDEDGIVSFQIAAGTFTDADNDTLTLTTQLSNGDPLPTWLTFDAEAKTFTGTPPANFNGSFEITVTASDGALSVSDTFVLNVTPVNDAPIIVDPIADVVSDEDAQVQFTLPESVFMDVDGDQLTLSATKADGDPLPAWLTFDAEAKTFTGTPPANFNGVLDIMVTASDGLLSVADTFQLTISPINDAPILATPIQDVTGLENQPLSVTISAQAFSDLDGDTLSYSANLSNGSVLPTWLQFNQETRTFTGTPPIGFSGVLDIAIIASDGSLSASDVFRLAIQPQVLDPYAGWTKGTANSDILFGNIFSMNRIFGDNGNDLITGGLFNDKIDGGNGNDWIVGLTGNDILNGNGGDDQLFGGIGNDVLNGGNGRDVLSGGFGSDVYVFSNAGDTGNAASLRDVIIDFTRGQDWIDIRSIDANTLIGGDQSFNFLNSKGAAFTGQAGQIRWLQENPWGTANDKTIIFGDINGDMISDFQIELTGLVNLSASDFWL